jgi:hypothetical protein
VVATNIAETSITVDDVVHVVDCCRAKEKHFDPVNKLPTLSPEWVSQASVKQRRCGQGLREPTAAAARSCCSQPPRCVPCSSCGDWQQACNLQGSLTECTALGRQASPIV